MQWILQDFEDTRALAETLDRLELAYTWHKVVPFVGDLIPAPDIRDPDDVVFFGAYTLWRYAEAHALRPGVIKVPPFVREKVWQPLMLNGPDARFVTLRDVPETFSETEGDWFVRPVDDGKETPGRVRSSAEIIEIAEKALSLPEDAIPEGSLRADTELMFTTPIRILQEWRLWVVADRIVAHSLYKEGARVLYRREIDHDALAFAETLLAANPNYAQAYVLDICRTDDGLRMIETNCINAAGFYAADLTPLVTAIDALVSHR